MDRLHLATFLSIILIVFNTTILFSQNTPPEVTNVHAEQRTGTKLVDISYDVDDADGDILQIEIKMSNDNGMTYSILPVSVSGDIHSGITPGTNKSIVWDAYPDYPDQLDSLCIFLIIARDYKGGISGSLFNEGYGDYLIVPEGVFQMGDPIYPPAQYDARPAHYVKLDSFYIGKYEITNGEYAKFISEGGYSNEAYWAAGGFEYGWTEPHLWNIALFKGGGIAGNENYPVISVSWFEANAYCSWLRHKTGHYYRLPTEAEWEKAAKGSVHRRYPWNDPWNDQGGDLWDIDTLHANYQSYEIDSASGRYKGYTLMPVGFYNGSSWTKDNSSPYGAYDMAGNVWEWCSDWNDWDLEWFDFGNYWYESQYYHYCSTQGIVHNPIGPLYDTVLTRKVIRGGDFQEPPQYLLTTRRYSLFPELRSKDMWTSIGVGFRCVLEQSSRVESPSNIFILDTRIMADFKQVEPGPSINHVDIPGNGSGYLYYDVSSDEVPLHTEDSIEFTLHKIGIDPVPCTGRFLDKGLFRVDLPSSSFATETAEYTFPESIQIGDTLYFFNEPIPLFTVTQTPLSFSRTWDVFAGRSVGVSGNIGLGAGASASALKLSVTGHGGVGLKVKLDGKGNIALDRRMELGLTREVSAPEINFVGGNVTAANAQLINKFQMGQSFQFTDLPIGEDYKKMAQTGFLLETFSLGGLGFAPQVAIVLLATVHTINSLSDVNSVFDVAILENYWGLGAEGSFTAGANLTVGEKDSNSKMSFKGGSYTFGGALQAKFNYKYDYPSPRGSDPMTPKVHTHDGMEVELAAKFDFKPLPINFPLPDFVELGSNNFSLFDVSGGASISFSAEGPVDQDYNKFSVGLKAGYEMTVLTEKETEYYNAKFEFSPLHIIALRTGTTSISKMITGSAPIPLSPQNLAMDAFTALDEVITAVGDVPVRLTTLETRGEPYDISLKLSFDFAIGVGLGGSFGITGRYLDEVEFPRKVTDIYLGRQNYLITSSEYADQMKNVSFTDMLETLFSGTIPLIQTALLNFQSILRKGFKAGEEFLAEVYSKTTQKVGEIVGKAPDFFGELIVSAYEMVTPRTSQKSFSTPEVRMMYYSTDVIHKSINENNELTLDEVETLLIMVSEAMTIGVIPDGDTVSIDSLETPVELKMIIYDQRLFDNDFTTDDKDKVKIYYYHIDSLCWILEGGTRIADTVSTSILKMGTYALGIELDVSEDITSPTIYEKGRDPDLVDNSTPEIFAKVRDDRFGSGIDLTKTHLILNGDTLDSYYDPSNEKVFYQFPDSSRLSDGSYKVNIIATDFAGNISKDSLSFTLEGTGTNIDSKIPVAFMLSQNYPNPFIESTTIKYSLAKEGDVEINIYNIKGQYVKRLIQNRLPAGEYKVVWDGTNSWGYKVSSGIYFYQLKFEDHNVVKKMQLIRGE